VNSSWFGAGRSRFTRLNRFTRISTTVVAAVLVAAAVGSIRAGGALLGAAAAAGPSGLVAAYNFEEATGNTVNDVSGNGNTGTISGATRTPTGKFGRALTFNGTSNYVSIPDSSSLRLTTGLTLEAWVNMTGGQSWRTVIFKEQTGGMAYSLYARNDANRPIGQLSIGNAERNAQGTAAVAMNAWVHLATTYDGVNQKLYVNGTQVATRAQTGSIVQGTGPLKIGGNGIWSEWFKGTIDEVRVYSRALSATEVQADMNTAISADTTPPTPPTDLVSTARTETSITLQWTAATDNVHVAGYTLYKNGAVAGSSNTTTGTITGLTCGASYQVGVDAVDDSGLHSTQTTIPASTADCDTMFPTVQITSPTGGTVNGAVTVSATAGDNLGVAGVQFKLDGNNLGAEDTTGPFSVSWDTTAGANGNHTLTAVARDTSGNKTTSDPVTVNVLNQAPNFVNDTLIIGLNEPTNLVFTPDGRMLIIERGGAIWVVQPGATSVDPTPVLTVPSVQTADERGLLGITLDPNFSSNGFFYVFYTNAATQKNQVSRFTMVGNTASLASQQMIWQNDDRADIWHQGGDMHFGPDGKLYVAVGDHLLPQSSQDVTSYNGKILRMNADGSAPTDNPFYDGAGPNKDTVWALGFRNPFRFSFDSVTGRMYVGDVGQSAWEEVDLATRGANYGWPTCEGNCDDPAMTNPIYTYNHNGRDACVIGGFVYRGTQFPSDYQGTYIFGDYSQRWFKRLKLDANGNSTGVVNFIPPDGRADVVENGAPVAAVMGPDGSLYYVDNGPFQANNAGSIRRVRNLNANQPPTAVASVDVNHGDTAPLTVHFSSAGSSDPEGQPLTYSWDFGDGTTSTAANPTHTYAAQGRYTARVTTSDGSSSTPSNALTVTVGRAPTLTIASPVDGAHFRAGDTISFSGSATDPEDGTIPQSGLSWKVVFHHLSHIHPFIDNSPGGSGSFVVPTAGHSFHETTWYELVLTAKDSDGIETQKSVNIYPDKVNLSVDTQPSGLTVQLDGIPMTTPFTYDDIIGFQHTISVDSPQFSGGSTYQFASWSDGGAQSHQITVPPSDSSLTARFDLTTGAPSGIVAAYNFNEGNLGTAYDVSGHGHDGNVGNAIWTGTGKYGGALSFNGSNAMVTVPDANDFDFTNGMTLEAWVNPVSPGNWSSVIFKEQPGGMLYSLYSNNGTNHPVGQLFLNNAEQNAPGSAAVPLNTWTHLASTYDGSTLKLYVNGVLAGSKAVTGSLAATTNPLRIGGNTIWSEWFSGQIDEVRLYKRALTPGEIQADMATPL
jgi:glucose/arabinose dehydrogenase